MITRKEYNKALDTVELYHKQLLQLCVNNSLKKQKTPIRTWGKFYDCPKKVQSVLEVMYDIAKDEHLEYIEDVTKNIFMRQRGAGKKGWEIFTELRGY